MSASTSRSTWSEVRIEVKVENARNAINTSMAQPIVVAITRANPQLMRVSEMEAVVERMYELSAPAIRPMSQSPIRCGKGNYCLP